eukprot:gnl/TRDRNA2_/TRDRNA2_139765_c0_seq1.p1 gnl/TRDRNA2_/TRDRNA2_139765_c0~~gnl/TRDRNA2_/TRDRNA2_139765_c0_seq1.p1  ORF type:complete len:340 (+),score=55.44 gnl/TRDRNA2_/TRDRNA2_139765_c0_seq1:54-1073(+)
MGTPTSPPAEVVEHAHEDEIWHPLKVEAKSSCAEPQEDTVQPPKIGSADPFADEVSEVLAGGTTPTRPRAVTAPEPFSDCQSERLDDLCSELNRPRALSVASLVTSTTLDVAATSLQATGAVAGVGVRVASAGLSTGWGATKLAVNTSVPYVGPVATSAVDLGISAASGVVSLASGAIGAAAHLVARDEGAGANGARVEIKFVVAILGRDEEACEDGSAVTKYSIQVAGPDILHVVRHRYSEFEELDSRVRSCMKNLPPMPPKSFLMKHVLPGFGQDRQEQLDKLLQAMVAQDGQLANPHLRAFLRVPLESTSASPEPTCASPEPAAARRASAPAMLVA